MPLDKDVLLTVRYNPTKGQLESLIDTYNENPSASGYNSSVGETVTRIGGYAFDSVKEFISRSLEYNQQNTLTNKFFTSGQIFVLKVGYDYLSTLHQERLLHGDVGLRDELVSGTQTGVGLILGEAASRLGGAAGSAAGFSIGGPLGGAIGAGTGSLTLGIITNEAYEAKFLNNDSESPKDIVGNWVRDAYNSQNDNSSIKISIQDNQGNNSLAHYYYQNSNFISSIATSIGLSVTELESIASNQYMGDRKVEAPNGGYMYLWKSGDKLNITPTDSDADYVPPAGYDYSIVFNGEDRDFTGAEIVKPANMSDTDAIKIPIPKLKPTNITVKNPDGTSTKYTGVPEDTANEETDPMQNGAFSKKFSEHMGDADGLDLSGVEEIHGENGIVYARADTAVGVSDGAGGTYQVALGSLVTMVEKGVAGFATFMTEVVSGTISEVNNQSPVLIAQIVAGVIAGRDIEDIAEEIAIQAVSMGAVEATLKALGGVTKDASGNVTISNEFGALLNDNALATEAIKGALTSVAMTAILHGRDAGFEGYATAAASASVSRVINYGITNSGYNLLTQQVGEQTVTKVVNGVATTSTVKVYAPTPAGAGAIAALTVVSSSLIAGNGVNEDTLRAATVAAGTAVAGSVIAGALFGTAATASAAATAGLFATYGAFAGPAGIVIGAVLGVVIGSLFKTKQGKVYHNETIGSIVQTLPDGTQILIGVRETGALLQANDNVADLIGTAGDDVLKGNNIKNTIIANGGDDMLEGRVGEDVLLAGAGNDYVEAGDGNDYIEGNEGNDAIRGDDGNDIILGGSGNDIISGGKGDDQIEGEADDDLISGDSGNDIILGGSGNDAIHGGAGNDVLSGDDGDDIIDGSIGDDEIHGDDGNDVLFGDTGNDTIRGGQGSDIIYGDEGVDILYGDLGNDILDGGKDADLLYGGLGKDVLFGQDGNDHIYGELGDDYIVGGKGSDKLDGGEGSDVYAFGKGDGQDIVEDSEGSADIIRLANYTIAEITFSHNGNDVIISAAPDGSDKITILNQLSSDAIEYLMFSDGTTIDMSSLAFDTNGVASYSLANISASQMVTQTTFAGTWQEAEEDRSYMAYNPYSGWYTNNYDINVISNEVDMELYNDVQVRRTEVKHKAWHGRTTSDIYFYDFIELNLIGTQGSDRIVGFNVAETINSLAGNDQVYGNSGSDTLTGGADHDIIYGGSQDDTINAGTGNDKAYGGIDNDTINGEGGNDTLYGQWGVDTIHGNDGDDMISGGADNDTLYGDAGNDLVYGDAGSDNLYGNDGNDFLIGGAGNDNLEGGAGDDYLEGGADNDTLRGGADNDILRGEDGTDSLAGDAGNDLLIGGKGADIIDGGSGIDTASYAESDAGVTINLATGASSGGYASGDTITNIENVTGSDYDDTLTGNNAANILQGGYGNDTLIGGDGNDELQGGAGADSLDGGTGWDKVSYADSVSGVEINFATGRGKYGHADGDIFVNMEHIIGSRFDDKFIIGNSSATFEAGDGYDTIVLQGNAADYQIILDRNILTARHIQSNQLFTFPDGERLQFNDKSYGLEDFPGDGDAIASILQNNSINGVILQNPGAETITLASTGSHGTAILKPDGTYTYTPTSNYLGSDTFAIRITDPVTGLIRVQNVDVSTHTLDVIKSTQVMANSNTAGQQTSPDIDMFADGSYVAVWYSNVDGVSSIHSKLFNSDGAAKTGDMLIASVYSVGHNQASVTVLGNGNYAISYSEYNVSTTNQNSTVKIFNSSNQLVNSFNLSSDQTSAQVSPVMETIDNDSFVVTWIGYSSSNRIYGKVYNNNGNPTSNEFLVNPIHNYPNGAPVVSSIGNGKFVVVWSDHSEYGVVAPNSYTHIYGQIVDKTGNKIGGEFKINSTNIGYQMDPKVTSLSNGNFVVAWYSSQTSQALMKTYDANGVAITDEIVLSENAHYPSISAFDNGNFIAVWYTYSGAANGRAGQLFDSNGSPIGGVLQISDAPVIFGERQSDIIARENGKFAVVWTGSQDANSSLDNNINFRSFQIDDRGVIEGTSGNDVLQAGSRNDTLIGHEGADILDGGAGVDNASYADSDAGITINLGAILVDTIGQTYAKGAGGHAEGDRLRNIENITGSNHNDTLSGNTTANRLDGGTGDDIISGAGGNDELIGGVGNDTITGGAGNDIITGGDGLDTAILSGAVSGYNIRVTGNTITIADTNIANGDDGTDTLTGIEKFTFAGSEFTISDFPKNEDSIANIIKNQVVTGILGDTSSNVFTLNQQAAFGTVVINSNGTYTYTPNAGYLGKDSFRYIDTNELGLNKIIEVQVNVSENGESRIVKAHNETQGYSSVSVLSDGGIAVAWVNMIYSLNTGQDGSGGGVFGQIFNADGTKRSGEFLVNSYTDNDQHDVKMSALTNGGFVATWSSSGQDGDNWGIYAQVFDAKGKAVGAEIQVNTYLQYGQQRPDVTGLENGDFIVSWDGMGGDGTQSGAFFQRYSSSGNPIGVETYVDAPHIHYNSSITSLKGGGFIVAWAGYDRILGADTDIFAQMYNESGFKIGNEIFVNQYYPGYHNDVRLTNLNDGGIAVTWWQQYGQDGDKSGVFGRVLNADGSFRSNEFRVNTTTAGYQANQDVTYLSNGNFIVVWQDYNDNYVSRIAGQLFNSNGGKVGGEIMIATGNDTQKHYPSVSSGENGGFVVTWSGNQTSGYYNTYIYTQKFDDSGAKIGDAFRVDTENSYYIPSHGNIEGTTGNDVIQTGAEDDSIDGGKGSDVLTTGLGKDTVIISLTPETRDIITDFNLTNDKVNLSAFDFLFTGFADLQSHMSQQGSDTVINFGNGQTLTLQNIIKANLSADNFIGKAAGNSAPVAALWKSDVDISDGTANIDVLASVSDLDGDAATLTAITAPANGNAAIVNGKIVYTANAGFEGYDYLDYTVSDGNGGFVIKTLTLNIAQINDGPTASDIAVAVNEDSHYVISAANLLLQSGASDIDGDVMTISGVQAASHGTVAFNEQTGDITFIPDADYNGAAGFTFTINDGHGGTITKAANLTINPVNDAPVATITTAYGNEDNAITIDVLSGSSDVDGDTLSISAITQGQYGTALIQGGKIVYNPGSNWNGTDQINYTISDGHGGTVVKTLGITVNGVNDAPVITTAILDQNILAGNNFSLDLGQGHFTDVDGDNLTYTITKPDGSNAPAWVNFNPVTMTLSGTAPFGTTGILALMVTASDGHASVAEAFDIDVSTPVIPLTVSGMEDIIYAGKSDISLASLNQNLDGIPVIETPDGQTVYPDAISPQRLTLAESGDVTITFKNSVAGYSNSLGWYTISDDGTISTPKLLLKNAHAVAGGTAYNLGNLPAGTQIGFFVAANGGNGVWLGTNGQAISMSQLDLVNGSFKFVNAGNNTSSVYDTTAATLVYTLNNVEYRLNQNVYHSSSNAKLNADGLVHSGAGWDSGRGDLLVGFEDLYGGGDKDYNDILFHVDLGSNNEAVRYAGAPNIAANFDITTAANTNIASSQIKISSGYKAGDSLVFEGHSIVNGVVSGTNIAASTAVVGGVLTLSLSGVASAETYENLMHSIKLVSVANADAAGTRDITISVTDSEGYSVSSTTKLAVTNNPVNGGSANDTLAGTVGNDNIYGHEGNDTITGGTGDDVLHGGLGNDAICGGFGADILTGGAGFDNFNYSNILDSTGGSFDTINDFTIGQDHIDLVALHTFGINSFSDLGITHSATETIITANDTVHPGATNHFELHLKGIIDLHQEDFLWG